MKIKTLILAIVAAFLMTGCTAGVGPFAPTPSPSPSPTPEPTVSPTPEPVMRMGTGGISGVYYSYGKAVGKVLSTRLGMPFNISQTQGAKENIKLIEHNMADIALSQNDVMYYAQNGIDMFTEDGAMKKFSAMAACYDEMCQIVAVKDITSVDELKGKNISVGSWEGGTLFNARQILEAYGISFDDITVHNLSFEDSANALREGRIDAFFCTSGSGVEAVSVLAEEGRVNLLPVDGEHISLIMQKYPFYIPSVVPKGTYKGIDADIPCVAVKSVFIVSNELEDNEVYDMTRALFEGKREIGENHPKGRDLDPLYAVSGLSVDIHPGAAYYYREIGVLPPLEVTPAPTQVPSPTATTIPTAE